MADVDEVLAPLGVNALGSSLVLLLLNNVLVKKQLKNNKKVVLYSLQLE